MVLGILCLCLSFMLIIHNRLESNAAEKASEEIMSDLEKTIDEGTDKDVNENGYIGYLTIEALDLKLPVMNEWDYDKLLVSPCRYYGSVKTDDLVICAHNSTAHFGRLKELNAGDVILFTDIHDNTYVYEVMDIEILEPTDIKEMIENDYDLTLYTCTYAGVARVTVRCNLVN